eukprot:2640274-Prymnesium_polylepis.1
MCHVDAGSRVQVAPRHPAAAPPAGPAYGARRRSDSLGPARVGGLFGPDRTSHFRSLRLRAEPFQSLG